MNATSQMNEQSYDQKMKDAMVSYGMVSLQALNPLCAYMYVGWVLLLLGIYPFLVKVGVVSLRRPLIMQVLLLSKEDYRSSSSFSTD